MLGLRGHWSSLCRLGTDQEVQKYNLFFLGGYRLLVKAIKFCGAYLLNNLGKFILGEKALFLGYSAFFTLFYKFQIF